MKLASYNLENLFLRAHALNGESWSDGKKALEAQAELSAILGKPVYTAADKKKILALLGVLKLDKSDDGGPFAILRQNSRPSGQARQDRDGDRRRRPQ